MKSNRQARRLLGVHINNTYRISNRRWLVWGSNWPHIWEHVKPSRQQRKAEKEFESLYHLLGQHTQGERE